MSAPQQFYRLMASATNLRVLAPTVTTVPMSGATSGSATLNGAVIPNGAVSAAWFEYGTDTNYGYATPSTLVSTSHAMALNVTVNGLVSGTTYHYRLVASNSAGITTGGDMTFTPP